MKFPQSFNWLLAGILSVLPVKSVLADGFIYAPGEHRLHNKCLVNFNRGKKCHALLDKLCNRIQNKNTECRLLRVEQCHKENRAHQTDAERTCEQGSHAGPCYGINNQCGFQEYLACQEANYQLRFCPYYKWQYCRRKVGMENGQFKSKDCRVFHNQEMIKFYERKISKALRWQPRGENNIEHSLALMKAQREQMRQQIEAIEKQEESLQALIGEVGKNWDQKITEQQRRLKKQKRQRWAKIRNLSILIDEYSYMGGLCDALGP
ncbi:MAG: hypothetical protein DRR19_13745 [Candidatus Parabeggiatoa sp. nov. 1]|nr:MAG: hypothetical protein DRR19_13745 [Gammaproteobacteria bacterium]